MPACAGKSRPHRRVLGKRPVRRDMAMTGEITLRGRVMPVGGLKEKLLAAHRAELKTVLIPKENEKELEDIPKKIKEMIEIVHVDHMDEVLERSLMEAITPVEEEFSDGGEDETEPTEAAYESEQVTDMPAG